MLDFEAVRSHKKTLAALTEGFTINDLRSLTVEMIDLMLQALTGVTDEDVIFVPNDPKADDPHATIETEKHMAWTLGHVIVHATASAEEAAFIAAEMARGVTPHGRSRYETPWQTVTTVAQCRHRLEESRRMRLASLDVWPDQPHLELLYGPTSGSQFQPYHCIQRFVMGLMHDDAHIGQITETARQAREARTTTAEHSAS